MKAARTRALHKKQHPHQAAAAAAKAQAAAKAKAAAKAHHAVAAQPAHKQQPPKTAAQIKLAHARALSPGSLVACCPFEALAAGLRLAGWPVGAEDVLDLYARVADGPDAGVTITAALAGAARWGLAGVRPLGFEPVELSGVVDEFDRADRGCAASLQQRRELHALQIGQADLADAVAVAPFDDHPPFGAVALDGHGGYVGGRDPALVFVHGFILGVDLPGPHAVFATPAGWWSWGELHDPAEWPDAVIGEAWWVRWQD